MLVNGTPVGDISCEINVCNEDLKRKLPFKQTIDESKIYICLISNTALTVLYPKSLPLWLGFIIFSKGFFDAPFPNEYSAYSKSEQLNIYW